MPESDESDRLRTDLEQARDDLHRVTQERNALLGEAGTRQQSRATLGVFLFLVGIGALLSFVF